MAKSFSKAIGDWASQSLERTNAVYARSVELLGEEMSRTIAEGGRVPIDTGNLANSLLADKSAMPSQSDGPFTGSNIGLIAATLKASDFVYIGYQAHYAIYQNNNAGHHFVEGAAAEWYNLVDQAVREVRGGR